MDARSGPAAMGGTASARGTHPAQPGRRIARVEPTDRPIHCSSNTYATSHEALRDLLAALLTSRSAQHSQVSSNARREVRATCVYERFNQALRRPSVVLARLPVSVLFLGDGAHVGWGTVIDEAQKLVCRVDVVRKQVCVAEVTRVIGHQNVRLTMRRGGVDMSVVLIAPRELDITRKIIDELVNYLADLAIDLSDDAAICLGVLAAHRAYRLGDHVERRVELEHVAGAQAAQKYPIAQRSTRKDV